MVHDAAIARTVLGSEDYDGLASFFDEVAGNFHFLKVAASRRCLALFHAFRAGRDGTLSDDVMGCDAIQTYAGFLADRYEATGGFPSVLVFDDVTPCGCSASRVLRKMEELTFEALRARGSAATRRDMHLAMLSCAEVMAYAMGDENDVADTAYLRSMTCRRRLHGSQLLQLARDVSRLIDHCDMANFPGLLSVRIDALPQPVDGIPWEGIAWEQWGSTDTVYLKADGEGRLLAAHAFSPEAGSHGGTWVTGFPYIREIPGETLATLCSQASSAIGCAGPGRLLSDVLSSDLRGLAGFKASFAAFLVSAATLWQLASDAGWNWSAVLGASNLPQASLDFGMPGNAHEPLSALLRDPDVLLGLVCPLLAGASCVTEGELAASPRDAAAIAMAAENMLCEAGMESAVWAFDVSRRKKTFVPLADDANGISLGCLIGEASGGDGTDPRILACVPSLLRHGVADLEYAADGTGDDGAICLLRAGKLSTHAFPQRHQLALSALARVETAALARGASPARLMSSFADAIDLGEHEDDTARRLLSDLREHVGHYAEASHGSGGNVARWNGVRWGDCDASCGDAARMAECVSLSGLLLGQADRFLAAGDLG